ncbi:MAG TPA: murein biosynthesis integral membrane protein MurJ [Nitrospirota bacterium]|nr:murein biosynthesis integral membrane protein MurJ [Nitrospirota bacterium]
MSEQVKVAKAAGIVGLATLASRIMGYIRDMVMSWAFGTGLAADAFYVAYRIPNLLRELLAEGSMSAAFIPVFTETLTKESRESAHRLANALLARLIILLVVCTVLGIVFAPYVVKFIALGWVQRAEHDKYVLGVSLTRLMFPYLFFIGIAALAMGMLNSLRSFLSPALSPVMLNVAQITAIVLSVRYLDEPIFGVAVGVVIGGLLQFLIQVPGLKKQNMMPRPQMNPGHPEIRKIASLATPVFFSSSVNQLNIFIGTIFASFLATGSITYLFYGMRFIHFPLGIFGIAVATAVLPSMSAQAARREMGEFRETFSFGLRLVFFIMFPAMAGLITLRVPIISLLLEHGQFDRLSTQGVSAALLFYAVGLWAMAGVRIVAQAYYSLQDTRTPVKIAVIALVVNILLSSLFVFWTPLAHGGLALATSLAATLNIVLLTWNLRRKIGRIDGARIMKSLLKIVPASIAMGFIGWWISGNPVWDKAGMTLVKAQLLAGGVALCIVFYLAAMVILRSEELKFLWNLVRTGRKAKL